MEELNTEQKFIWKWFSCLFAIWYISVMLYIHNPKLLHMLYWPLHTHDIEIEVIKRDTVNWQSYIDKLDRDLEIGFLYIEEVVEEIIIEPVIEEPDSLMIKLGRYINE